MMKRKSNKIRRRHQRSPFDFAIAGSCCCIVSSALLVVVAAGCSMLLAVVVSGNDVVVTNLVDPSSSSSSSQTLLKWESRTGLPSGLGGIHHPITFSNGTHGFLLSGSTLENPYTNNFFIYDGAADSWSNNLNETSNWAFPGLPRSFGYGVSSSSSCNNNNKAYLGFGAARNDQWNLDDDNLGGFDLRLTDFWEFDMSTGKWTRLAEFPGPGRKHPAMNFVESLGEIHVGLGDGFGGNYNDWWSYSVARNEWTQLPDFPGTARHHPYYFALDTDSYVGFGHSSVIPYIERDWYRWDAINREWSRENDFESYANNDFSIFPTTTEARVAGTQFSIMYDDAVGCNDNTIHNSGDTISAVTARASGSTAGVGGTKSLGFVLSGDGDDHRTMETGEFHSYDPDTHRWTTLPSHPGPSRWAPGSFVLNEPTTTATRVYMIGGYDRSTRTLHGDVWTMDLSPLFTTTSDSDTTDTTSTATTNIEEEVDDLTQGSGDTVQENDEEEVDLVTDDPYIIMTDDEKLDMLFNFDEQQKQDEFSSWYGISESSGSGENSGSAGCKFLFGSVITMMFLVAGL